MNKGDTITIFLNYTVDGVPIAENDFDEIEFSIGSKRYTLTGEDIVWDESAGAYKIALYPSQMPQAIADIQPQISLQRKTKSYTPSETAQAETVAADSNYDGLEQVNVSVGAIASDYVGSGVTRRSSSNMTASGATVTAPAGYYASSASKSVASGSEGTPTATKGTVSGHAVTVTQKVTNAAGYIAGGTKTGTGVSVTAAELVSGSETKTENGTYDVYWSAFRSSTSASYTYGTQLYIGGTAYGTENTAWSNHVQNNHLSNVSLAANQKIRVRGRNSRGSSYYIYAPTLVIIES